MFYHRYNYGYTDHRNNRDDWYDQHHRDWNHGNYQYRDNGNYQHRDNGNNHFRCGHNFRHNRHQWNGNFESLVRSRCQHDRNDGNYGNNYNGDNRNYRNYGNHHDGDNWNYRNYGNHHDGDN